MRIHNRRSRRFTVILGKPAAGYWVSIISLGLEVFIADIVHDWPEMAECVEHHIKKFAAAFDIAGLINISNLNYQPEYSTSILTGSGGGGLSPIIAAMAAPTSWSILKGMMANSLSDCKRPDQASNTCYPRVVMCCNKYRELDHLYDRINPIMIPGCLVGSPFSEQCSELVGFRNPAIVQC